MSEKKIGLGQVQLGIGQTVNAAKRIYKSHPDTKGDLIDMIKAFARVYDAWDGSKDEHSSLAQIMISQLDEEI